MNRWKIAFWICLTTLILVLAFGLYAIIDQSVTLTYMKEGYSNTDNDLTNVSKIINETDLTKEQIKESLKTHKLFEYMDFTKDTISLEKVNLVFKNNKLNKVIQQ